MTFTQVKKVFNTKKFVFGFLIILLAIELFWFFVKVPSSPVIIFPAVESRTVSKKDFDNNSVSLEINRFIADGAEQKTLWKLKYVDAEVSRTLGWELVYELDSGSYNLAEFYEQQLKVVKNNGWKLLATNLEDSSAFLDIQRKHTSAEYKVRISLEHQEEQLNVKAQYLITRD